MDRWDKLFEKEKKVKDITGWVVWFVVMIMAYTVIIVAASKGL